MIDKIVTNPFHGNELVTPERAATDEMQLYLDDLTEKINELVELLDTAVALTSYTVATLPTAADSTGGLIYVSDETGGAVPAFSDGTDWRRVTDRAIVS